MRIASVTLCLTHLSQQRHDIKTSRNKHKATAVLLQRYNEAEERKQHTKQKLFTLVLGDLGLPQRYY
jgi:hypothetical protein